MSPTNLSTIDKLDDSILIFNFKEITLLKEITLIIIIAMKGDYRRKICKIEPIVDHDENEVYYGSTTQLLCKRMGTHRGHGKYGMVTVVIVVL